MTRKINDVQGCILSLLYSNNSEAIRRKPWFQKEMFLITKNFPDLEEELDFEPYLYGPDSEIAEEELEQLRKAHLVKFEGNKIILTETGKRLANEYYRKDKKKSRIIDRLKEFANNLTSDELLAFVYFSYPEMVQESAIYNRILSKRKQLAISLLKKDKVTIAKAAEISGEPLEDFIKEIEK
jgi:hypothetical protein